MIKLLYTNCSKNIFADQRKWVPHDGEKGGGLAGSYRFVLLDLFLLASSSVIVLISLHGFIICCHFDHHLPHQRRQGHRFSIRNQNDYWDLLFWYSLVLMSISPVTMTTMRIMMMTKKMTTMMTRDCHHPGVKVVINQLHDCISLPLRHTIKTT